MALVPYRASGPAADQRTEQRFFQFGNVVVTIKQQPRLSGAAQHQQARPASAAAGPAAVELLPEESGPAAQPTGQPTGQATGQATGSPPSQRDMPDLSHVGLVVWESGFVLADFLLRHPPYGEWGGVRVVDLGSGTGLLGVALALAGAQVVLTDLPHITPLTIENLHSNCGSACPSARVDTLDWSRRETCSQYAPDLITGGDLLYDPGLFDDLAQTIAALTAGSSWHCVTYLAYRSRDGREQGFQAHAERLGFGVQHVGQEQLHEDYRSSGCYHILKLSWLG